MHHTALYPYKATNHDYVTCKKREHILELTADQFRSWKNKRITLLGMSGVGKTRLASLLPQQSWFHYSGDYRIGTCYLDEPILDNIKKQAMQVPFLRDLLLSDSIYICNNITVDHLKPVSSFLGKLGNPELGGMPLTEFKRRQELHHQAEIAAMKDVPQFIRNAHEIYGYRHFVNDAGGSVCELDDESVLQSLSEHTLILYLEATESDEQALIQRAVSDPKPLYYRESFLDEQLAIYMQENQIGYIALIDPDDFVRWIFPRLFYSRIPRYKRIAQQYGYTIRSSEIAGLSSEEDFMSLVEQAIRDKNQ